MVGRPMRRKGERRKKGVKLGPNMGYKDPKEVVATFLKRVEENERIRKEGVRALRVKDGLFI